MPNFNGVWSLTTYLQYSSLDGWSFSPPPGKAFWHGGATAGDNRRNDIQTITFATLGDATDYGDLTATRFKLSGCSNSTRGIARGS